MIIATFGPDTGWAGKTISRVGDVFSLEDHGPITAADVMEYDRQSQLVWASDGTRAWVGAKAAEAHKRAQRKPSALAQALRRRPAATEPPAQSEDATSTPAEVTAQGVTIGPVRLPWWKRPHVLVPLVLAVALGAALIALGLSMVSSKLTPQEIYQRNVAGVVQVRTTFPATYDVYGQQTGGGDGLGTGFVVSKDGYILTNAHVVSEGGQAASSVIVVFKENGAQGRQMRGRVVSADESTDVALIKVDPERAPELVPVPLGDSSKATVGEAVVAIGNPLGLDSSLSLGVVSATDRDLESPNGTNITGGIQTDAAINPGNSGGPLIDSTGHVIGINEQIDTMSGGNEGIGFAVPINTAISVMKRMMEADAQAQ